jgi:acetyl-CoA decarbonylase/synthase complex subunit gamma
LLTFIGVAAVKAGGVSWRRTMALSGLEIFKLLPKTNCGDCGRPTCLAFAMALAQKKASLEECPHVSEEAQKALGAAAAPPIKLVPIGAGEGALTIGEENVLFRHDEKFYHPAGVAVTVSDVLEGADLDGRLAAINDLRFHRVGTDIQVNLVEVREESGDPARFAQAVAKAASATDLHLMLTSSSPDALRAAVTDGVASRRPLLCEATGESWGAIAALATEADCPVGVRADGLESLAELAEKLKGAGVSEMVLDVTAERPLGTLQNLTRARRLALKRTFRPLGFPTMARAPPDEPHDEVAWASAFMAKYAGIVITQCVDRAQLLPVLTVRQNIYTDPQKPVQVEPGLYPIGEPGPQAPLMFTTNFSLTYYSVEGEVEASRVPAYILAVDTEGLSVLTSYSGDKLNEKVVHEAMQKFKVEEKVNHRKLIIPGYVAVLSGKLEEETGWEILVGPKEASQLPNYLQTQWKK